MNTNTNMSIGTSTSANTSMCTTDTTPTTTNTAEVAVRVWLASVSPHLVQYAAAFAQYGYESTVIMADSNEADFAADMEELNVKKPHRRTILRAFRELREL